MKAFLTGIGSILDVSSSTQYRDFIPKQTAEERMRSHWEKTGNHIRNAMCEFENGQKQK
jgi:hypothetical protein